GDLPSNTRWARSTRAPLQRRRLTRQSHVGMPGSMQGLCNSLSRLVRAHVGWELSATTDRSMQPLRIDLPRNLGLTSRCLRLQINQASLRFSNISDSMSIFATCAWKSYCV